MTDKKCHQFVSSSKEVFCRNRSWCPQPHNNVVCKERVCRDPNCRERHPKTCKFYARSGGCRWNKECAYVHNKLENNDKLCMIEKEVENLKDNIKHIKKENDAKNIEILEIVKLLKVQVNSLQNELKASKQSLDERNELISTEINTNGETSESVTKEDTIKCSECDYQCEKNIFMIKHINTKHRNSFKCSQCSDVFKDINEMEAHTMKEHSNQPKLSGDGRKNVKCDKCNSKFTSRMALSQHMFTTHTPTRIEETGIFCNLCGEEFWTELDMIKHLEEHMKGNKTNEPFFCKLCGIGLSERNAINQHMISHVENVLKEDCEAKESRKEVVQKLATITENEEEAKSEEELDQEDEEDFETFMKEFDEDGKRILNYD